MSAPPATRRQGLPDWVVIARREFLERVRTVWFAIVTALGPVGMIAMIVIPVVLARSGRAAKIQVRDQSGRIGAPLALALARDYGWTASVVPADTGDEVLLGRIADKTINGFVTVPKDVLRGGVVSYQGDNATSQAVVILLDRGITGAVYGARGHDAGLGDAQLDALLQPVKLSSRHTTGGTEGATGGAVFVLGYAVMIILYMAIVLYAVNVLRSVVQEKTNRVVEIMVAAAKPRALMLGKILGVGAVGLLQLAIWMAMAVVIITYREQVLGLFGVSGAGFTLPPLSVVDAVVIIAYFLLGYFFYASLYAAIGAMVSSEQEAQQAQTPVALLLVIPMTCVQIVANDPRGGAAEALTLIPFSSPILMPMRYLLGGASGLDVGLSLVLLSISAYVVARLAGRIYRVGILMYGKRPSLRELLRWLKYT